MTGSITTAGVLEYGGGSLRSNHVGARRLRFEGMLRNGAPGGRGVFVWASHGAKGKHTASNTVTLVRHAEMTQCGWVNLFFPPRGNPEVHARCAHCCQSITTCQEYGEFADQQAVCCLHEAACATMVALARACATAARKVCAAPSPATRVFFGVPVFFSAQVFFFNVCMHAHDHQAACLDGKEMLHERVCVCQARRDVRQSLSTHGLSDIVSQMPSLGPFGAPRLPTPTLDAMCGAAAQAAATGARRGQGKRLMT